MQARSKYSWVVGTLCCVATLCGALVSCAPDPEPLIEPPQPVFVASTRPPIAEEHGIYADVDPAKNAVWLEWYSDETKKTSGYDIYRSADSLKDEAGLLTNRTLIAHIEPSNLLFERLDTLYRDTNAVGTGVKYWYQIQAFIRSATNRLAFSHPTAVVDSLTFRFRVPPVPNVPASEITLPQQGSIVFSWNDVEASGFYQLIVERTDVQQLVWSSPLIIDQVFTTIVQDYPTDGSATPLVRGAKYRWRIKKVGLYAGSSSIWQDFSVKQ